MLEFNDEKLKQENNEDKKYVKEVLVGAKKNATEMKPKNRSLMNPMQRKRKQGGIKFEG